MNESVEGMCCVQNSCVQNKSIKQEISEIKSDVKIFNIIIINLTFLVQMWPKKENHKTHLYVTIKSFLILDRLKKVQGQKSPWLYVKEHAFLRI